MQDKSPGYEANDVGFEVYTNRRAVATDIGYAEYRPGSLFRNCRADVFTTHEWDYDWNRITFDIGLDQEVRFRNFWEARLTSTSIPATSDDHLTRGGPLTLAPSARELTLQIDSDPRRRHTVRTGHELLLDHGGGARSDAHARRSRSSPAPTSRSRSRPA